MMHDVQVSACGALIKQLFLTIGLTLLAHKVFRQHCPPPKNQYVDAVRTGE